MTKTTIVDMTWEGGAKGKGSLKSTFLDTSVAIPKALGGSGEGANPKELLVSSAASCYMLTLAFLVESKKLPVASLEMRSDAVAGDEGMKITHDISVTLTAEATDAEVETMKRVLQEAEKGCEVGNLLKNAGVIINLESEVIVG